MRHMIGLILFLAAFSVMADSLSELQDRWAIANYQLTGAEQASAFERLIESVDAAVAQEPNDPALLVWQGIIKSTWAGKASGLSALKLVKSARASLEQAIELDDTVLDGSAYTSLGALYYQVPGWPIAFGSDKKARELLEKAITINPDGIDSNYFYGEFLIAQKELPKARQVLAKAMAAPPRPGRELADQGRRQDIARLLQTIDS